MEKHRSRFSTLGSIEFCFVKNSQRAVTEDNCMAAAETSRMLRVVASVPVLTFPPPPKTLPLGFHRVDCRCAF
jgi:hypothetical protein